MARISNVYCFLLVLFVFSSVEKMVTKVDAASCVTVLNRDSCDLTECEKQCDEKYSGNGSCVEKAGGVYFCQCVYHC